MEANSVPAKFDSPQLSPDEEFGQHLADRAAGARERAENLEFQAAQQRRIEKAAAAALDSLQQEASVGQTAPAQSY
jgi:hypothetical protein